LLILGLHSSSAFTTSHKLFLFVLVATELHLLIFLNLKNVIKLRLNNSAEGISSGMWGTGAGAETHFNSPLLQPESISVCTSSLITCICKMETASFVMWQQSQTGN